MRRLTACGPRGSKIPQFGLDALDAQSDRTATCKNQRDEPARGVVFLELHSEQRQHLALGLQVDALQSRAQHPLEAQRRPAPFHSWLITIGARRRSPIEPIRNGDKPPFARLVGHIGDLQHRILKMRGHDREVVGVEREKL